MAGEQMTMYATSQPDVEMEKTLAGAAGPPGPTGSATEQPDLANDPSLADPAGTTVTRAQREIHVQFNYGMWWAMPHELSDPILEEWYQGSVEVSYVWDWEDTRMGSYRTPEGDETSFNRYVINFNTMYQRNTDNNRTRKVKVVDVMRS